MPFGHDLLALSHWQGEDPGHPGGSGQPVYRVVYKTLGVVLPGTCEVTWPDLVLRMSHGDVTAGGMSVSGAVQSRHPDVLVVGAFGHLIDNGDGTSRYEGKPPQAVQAQVWERTWAGVSYVELLLRTHGTEPQAQLAEGRARLATLLALIDLGLRYGLLGARLAEEVGEVFPDGHFNRHANEKGLQFEHELDFVALTTEEFDRWGQDYLKPYLALDDEAKAKYQLACDWYWSGLHADTPTLSYLHLWTVAEILMFPEGSNNPSDAAAALDALMGKPARAVTRRWMADLWKARNAIVHHGAKLGDSETYDRLKLTVEVVMERTLGIDSAPSRALDHLLSQPQPGHS